MRPTLLAVFFSFGIISVALADSTDCTFAGYKSFSKAVCQPAKQKGARVPYYICRSGDFASSDDENYQSLFANPGTSYLTDSYYNPLSSNASRLPNGCMVVYKCAGGQWNLRGGSHNLYFTAQCAIIGAV